MKYTTYLFDFDYTLADSSRGIVICFRNVLERHNYTDVTDEAIKRTIGKTLEESFSILTSITDSEQLAALRKEYSKESDQFMNINTHLFEDTLPTLHKLKKQGIRIGIISTKYRFRIQSFLQQYLPKNYFDIIVGGEDVSSPKPNPEGLLLAIHQLDVSLAETMYIGDSTVDAETAANAGVDFTGVISGATTAEELKQYPHARIITRLNELIESNRQKHPIRKASLARTIRTYFRLIHIKQIRGPITLKIITEIYTCKNCKTTFTGQYCNHCGQSSNTPRYTFRAVIQNILSGITCIDHGLGYTLIELLIRPGHMIHDYIAGKRIRYFRPFQTLFVLAAIYILLVQLIDPKALEDKQTPAPKEALTTAYQSIDNIAGKTDSISLIELKNIKQELKTDISQIDSIEKRIAANSTISRKQSLGNDANKILNQYSAFSKETPFIQAASQLFSKWAHGNKAVTILCIIPILALSMKWSFRKYIIRSNYNYVELLFVQAYVACQILLINIFYFPFYGRANVNNLYDVPWWIIIVLSIWTFMQLFHSNWIQTSLRTLLMFLYSLIIIILCALFIATLLILGTIAYNNWIGS